MRLSRPKLALLVIAAVILADFLVIEPFQLQLLQFLKENVDSAINPVSVSPKDDIARNKSSIITQLLPHHVSLSQNPPTRYLVVDLRGGITNQAIEVWTALLISQRLNRTLLLPRVRSKIKKGGIYAHEQSSELAPFDYLWDDAHFLECAREQLNNPDLIIDTNTTHYQVPIDEEHSYTLQQFDGIDHITPLLRGNHSETTTLAARLAADAATYVKVINPFKFNIMDGVTNGCFRPSTRWSDMIAGYKSALGNQYSCLHARTESDWYSLFCCKGKANTSEVHPELWSCTQFKRDTCYMTPKQIAKRLQEELPLNSTLWVSSGSSREALEPLYDSFRIFSKDDRMGDTHYMDYGLAMIDREICMNATKFWGMIGSTFSMEVGSAVRRKGGKYSHYN